MKTKAKKNKIIVILLIICFTFFQLYIMTVNAADIKPTLWIKVHRIKALDYIEEGWFEGEADFRYRISVYNGNEWLYHVYTSETNDDDVEVDYTHSFTVEQTSYIKIYIQVWEMDGTIYDQDVDIAKDTQVLDIYYNMKSNSVIGEYVEELGYLKTDGEWDGSEGTEIDENDAALWFLIWDNYESPVAYAGPDRTVMVGDKVNFIGSGSSASIGSSLELFQWDFENDGVYDAQGEQTSYTYNQKGTYTVKLKVTDSIGETHTDTSILNVITPDEPVADAGPDQTTYVGERVDFSGFGSTASAGATIERYQWDYENDGVYDSEGENTFWTYDTEGTFTAKLNVIDNYGQTDTDTCIVRVRIPPIQTSFTYTPQEITIQDTVYFYDTSNDPDGSVVSWNWDFGDGFTSELKDPTHDYLDKGSYTVALTVTDNDGNPGIIEDIITVFNLSPTADFTYSPSSPIVGKDVQFTDISSDAEGKSLEHLWDFGDGFTSSQRNPKHKFANSGIKGVKLTVTDDEGAINSILKNIRIEKNDLPEPEFSYSPENPKMNQDVQFSDESTDSDGYIVGCLWNFGDGSTSTMENPVHRYEEGGEYTVKLTVTDDADDTEDKIKIVNILQTHDLTVEVKDILGVKIANAEIELYADGESCASGKTDTNGKLTFPEIAEGQYDIKVNVMGQTVSTTRSLSQPVTAQVQVTLSTTTLGITGGIVVIVAIAGSYLMRRKKTTLPAEETSQEVESVSVVEDDSLKEKKKELERERITEILQTFKNSFEKGEMNEETYLRLKAKYEKEVEELE